MVRMVRERTGETTATTEKVIDTFLDVIQMCLKMDEPVSLSGFGRFECKVKNAVIRPIPSSDRKVIVPSRRYPHFVASQKLKDCIHAALDEDPGVEWTGEPTTN